MVESADNFICILEASFLQERAEQVNRRALIVPYLNIYLLDKNHEIEKNIVGVGPCCFNAIADWKNSEISMLFRKTIF